MEIYLLTYGQVIDWCPLSFLLWRTPSYFFFSCELKLYQLLTDKRRIFCHGFSTIITITTPGFRFMLRLLEAAFF